MTYHDPKYPDEVTRPPAYDREDEKVPDPDPDEFCPYCGLRVEKCECYDFYGDEDDDDDFEDD